MEKLLIAIDGPAGAGKSTIAQALAKRLDIPYFSTGAMYRAFAVKYLSLGLDATSESDACWIAQNSSVYMKYKNGKQYVLLDGIDVTDKLYSDEISRVASQISVHKVIRQKMVEIQRQAANSQSLVMDGRDIGSVVLPDAKYKFYLDASVEIRAQRRYQELINKGENVTFDEVLKDMKERDYRDKTREISPLVICKDAIVIDCSNLNIEQCVEEFLKYIE